MCWNNGEEEATVWSRQFHAALYQLFYEENKYILFTNISMVKKKTVYQPKWEKPVSKFKK